MDALKWIILILALSYAAYKGYAAYSGYGASDEKSRAVEKALADVNEELRQIKLILSNILHRLDKDLPD